MCRSPENRDDGATAAHSGARCNCRVLGAANRCQQRDSLPWSQLALLLLLDGRREKVWEGRRLRVLLPLLLRAQRRGFQLQVEGGRTPTAAAAAVSATFAAAAASAAAAATLAPWELYDRPEAGDHGGRPGVNGVGQERRQKQPRHRCQRRQPDTGARPAGECSEDVTPSTFTRRMLWNATRTLSYTVDLSKVGCACNAALYLVAMPYHDKSACGDYYCDASFPHCHCPEMDIQEANTHAWAATPHKCTGKKGDYTSCDHGGCGKQFSGSEYGPGKTIDTNKPFQVSVTLSPSSVVKLKQGSEMASVHDPCSVNSESLTDGMVVAISNWGQSGSGMGWLDKDRGCGPNTQCNNGAATWSDLRLCAAGKDFCE